MNELKQCPFCGGEAELNESASGFPYFSIWCKNEHCFAGAVQVRDFDKERLVNSWNTRADRTCRMNMKEPEYVLSGWWECDKCGVVYPPCNEEIAKWALQYCPHCGAKVVE